MAKQDWGTKRLCQSCATKFYDFGRTPIVCPKCETTFDPETLSKARRSRTTPAAKTAKPVKAPQPAKDDGDNLDINDNGEDAVKTDEPDDGDDTVLVDASDLGGDDVDEVVGASNKGKEDGDT